jgi:VanZ family protein
MTADRTTQRVCTAAAASFIAFAVWGSLFPFDFRAVPWSDAVARFWSPWSVPLARWSLSDFVSNVLLFVPIGLFAMASIAPVTRAGAGFQPAQGALKGRPCTCGFVVIAMSIALSTLIELAQAFVSWRTPSVVDVGAETMGALFGVAMWWVVGGALDAAIVAAVATVRRSPVGEKLLLAYCAIFAAAWLVPADFTLRPNEIADKYAHQRLLLPFMPSPDAATAGHLALIGAAAMPIGMTAALCGYGGVARRSLPAAALIATTFLVGLEAAQVFVFSRTTDATALLVASATAAIGAALVAAAGRRRPIAAAE